MSYEKTTWTNEVTPVNATNMNHIEEGIEAIDTGKQNTLTAGTGITIANDTISINGTIYKYKGSCVYADLPEDAESGDVWNVTDTHETYPAGTNYAWTGSEWDALGGSIDLSAYATTSALNTGLATKQDSLPSGSNDTYLHKNSITGNLEWASLPEANGVNF